MAIGRSEWGQMGGWGRFLVVAAEKSPRSLFDYSAIYN